jgi:hypothetical protein
LTQLKSGTVQKIEQELELPDKEGRKRCYIVQLRSLVEGTAPSEALWRASMISLKEKAIEKDLEGTSALKTALAELANIMRGGPDPRTLCRDIITFCANILEPKSVSCTWPRMTVC